MADIRPLAIDDTDSIIRSFHLDLQPSPQFGLEPPAEGVAQSKEVALEEGVLKAELAAQPNGDSATQPDGEPAAQLNEESAAQPNGESAAQPNGESVTQAEPEPEPQSNPVAQPESVQVS